MPNHKQKKPVTYESSGVDIDAAQDLIEKIRPIAEATHKEGVIGSIGGFGGLFELPKHYKEPVLVSATDGVGTKLKLAQELDTNDTIGIDLVAMCVNDVLVQGATPLFFLDYFATGKLRTSIAKEIITGISDGCKQAGMALIGGETAEMPIIYKKNEYDLAGFCVGIVEKENILPSDKISAGDILIGISSSGVHSNGYSLINKIIDNDYKKLNEVLDNETLGQLLLTPTRIYVESLMPLIKNKLIKGLAHITGGGITENIPRILQKNLCAEIDTGAWIMPSIFNWIQDQSCIENDEMYKVFNCGIGMVLTCDKQNVHEIVNTINKDYPAYVIGEIKKSNMPPSVNYI